MSRIPTSAREMPPLNVPHPEEEGGDVEGEDCVPVEDDGEAEDEVESTSNLL